LFKYLSATEVERESKVAPHVFSGTEYKIKGHYDVVMTLVPAAPSLPSSNADTAPTARDVEAAFLLSYPASHTRRAYAT
jgi:hypothetical protein